MEYFMILSTWLFILSIKEGVYFESIKGGWKM